MKYLAGVLSDISPISLRLASIQTYTDEKQSKSEAKRGVTGKKRGYYY